MIIMVRSHHRSEYLDLPEWPNSATELDQMFGGGSARHVVDHTRPTQYPSRPLPDHFLTTSRPLADTHPDSYSTCQTPFWCSLDERDQPDIFLTSAQPRPDLYPTMYYRTRQQQTRYKTSILFGIQLIKRSNIT